MIYVMYNKHLPCLKSWAFVNLGEISVLTLSITVRALTPAEPVQQYGQLETVVKDTENLYTAVWNQWNGMVEWNTGMNQLVF